MINNNREILGKLATAEVNLLDARRYLDSGNAINWVADKLYGAVISGMEAWLIKHRNTLDFSKGLYSMILQFKKAAPENLESIASDCASKATSLRWQLDSDLEAEYEYPPWSLEKWRKDAYACLEKVEEFIKMIKGDIC